MDRDVALGIDAELALAPVLDFIGFQGVLDFPRIHQCHQRLPFAQKFGIEPRPIITIYRFDPRDGGAFG